MSTPPDKKPPHQEPLNEHALSKLIDAQLLKVRNDSKELELKDKQQDHNAKYAESWLHHQADIIKRAPSEHRKTVTRWAYVAGGLVAMFLLFISYCLYLGKDQFVIETIKALGYPVGVVAGYYFGRRKNDVGNADKNSPDPIQPYQEVD